MSAAASPPRARSLPLRAAWVTPSRLLAAVSTLLLMATWLFVSSERRCGQLALQHRRAGGGSQRRQQEQRQPPAAQPGLPRLIHQSWKSKELPER